MFFEALQSYCAPVLTSAVFIAIVMFDTIFDKRTRNLFLCESFVVLLIIAATWADRCLSAAVLDGAAWKLRTMTTYINFSFSPSSPLILMMIYNKKPIKKQLVYFIPMVINLIFCFLSIFTGCIFNITPENVYSRGPLFFIPFLVSAFYLFGMVAFSAKEERKLFSDSTHIGTFRFNRREETKTLIIIMLAITAATLFEIIFVKRFMLWSTTQVCVVLYFTVLSRQKVKYDDLTGTYSRAAYSKRIERFLGNGKKSYVFAMIDIDGLKKINDTLGHASGDEAILRVTNRIIKNINRNMQLYRIGGDEFVLIAEKTTQQSIEAMLENAVKGCGKIGNLTVSFSYGTATLGENDVYEDVRNLADERLYENKALRKSGAFE